MAPVRPGTPHDNGFTLVEVLFALALVVTLAAGVTQLFGAAVVASDQARAFTSTTILAAQKMEQLRTLAWRVAALQPGLAVSDAATDLSQDPPVAGGCGLCPSPPDSLDRNTTGYTDFLDAAGRWVGAGATAPQGAVYIRRWQVAALPADPMDSRVLQVLVTTVSAERRRVSGAASRALLPGDALVGSVKTRRVVG